MSENSDITRPLIDALNQTGGLALRMNSGKVRVKGGFMQLHEKGTADILFFPRNNTGIEWDIDYMRPVWIETKAVKREGHKEQREAQDAFRHRVEALGHEYVYCRSVAEGLEAAL